jgi:hypothetical protein
VWIERNFSLDRIADRYLALYEMVLSHRRRARHAA